MKKQLGGRSEGYQSHLQALCDALLTAQNAEDMANLLRDLCTPAELESLVDRWRAAELLDQSISYREIHERTGVSVTTVGRVARFLEDGSGGYRMALQRLGKTNGRNNE